MAIPTGKPTLELRALPPMRSRFVSGGSIGSGVGAGIGSIIPGVGTVVGGLVGGFLGSLFGGGGSSAPPTLEQQFIDTLRSYFPNQDAPICGTPINIDFLNGGSPGVLNIPCDDPNFGNFTRSSIEWWIRAAGLGVVMQNLQHFIALPQSAQQAQQSQPANITNVINITDSSAATAIDSVAAAVNAGISQAVGQAAAVATSVTNDITGQLATTTSLLNGFVGSIQTGIPQFFSSLISGLLGPQNAIQASIAQDLASVAGLVNSLSATITGTLGGVLKGIGAGVVDIEKTIASQLGTLGGDVTQLLSKLGDGVPNAINDVEKVLERIAGIWSDIHSTINLGKIEADLKKMGDAIAGIAGKPIDTVFRPIDLISETCDVAKYDEQVSAAKDSVDSLDQPWKGLANIGMYVFLQAARMLATVEKVKEQGIDSINQECPITKIDPGTVVSLWRRGILNEESARTELLKQGFNPDRQKVLYDGTAFLESPATALDYWYRRIASDDDLRGLLLSNGFSVSQVEAFKAASVQLGDPQAALRGWLYGVLDEGEVDKVLNVNRYDEAQRELFKQISRRPPSANEVLEGENTRHALGAFSLPDILGIGTDWDSIPKWYQDAGRAEGLNDEAIKQRWWAHWNLPSPDVVIQQYFRGERTLDEVRTIMGRYYIPSTLQLDLINVARPLIPFRSIPAMLAAGVLDEAGARHRLAMHGFSGPDIDVLIKLAKQHKPAQSTATASQAHATSIASARALFEQGAITEEQYAEVLAEHGIAPSAIAAELQVAKLDEAVKQRRQAGVDIVNEFQAGLITLDQARQQLAELNLTIAEQARYAKQLKQAKTAIAKIPSEGDLNHFLQTSIITSDQYVAALEAAGYSAEWAQAFLRWRTNTAAPQSGTTPTMPSGQGG